MKDIQEKPFKFLKIISFLLFILLSFQIFFNIFGYVSIQQTYRVFPEEHVNNLAEKTCLIKWAKEMKWPYIIIWTFYLIWTGIIIWKDKFMTKLYFTYFLSIIILILILDFYLFKAVYTLGNDAIKTYLINKP
jgi:hypothetical protein